MSLTREQKLAEAKAIIEKWVPTGFSQEPAESRLLRALLHANACVEDLRRALRGEQTVNSLEDYPQ